MITLSGCLAALVTPFDADGNVDERALRALVRRQLDDGTDGIVPCGTTGEGATLTDDETDRVVSIVMDVVNGRVPVVAGGGSNDTTVAVEKARRLASLGVDAVLSVALGNCPGVPLILSSRDSRSDEGPYEKVQKRNTVVR